MTIISPERIAEMLQFTRRYGSGNGWTGTLGLACSFIHELLKEREETATISQHVDGGETLILSAINPCRHCGKRCAELEWGDPSWPDHGLVVRICAMCSEVAIHARGHDGLPFGDKDDERTAYRSPVEAVAEWNERFGIEPAKEEA